jgi:hypothetical protein
VYAMPELRRLIAETQEPAATAERTEVQPEATPVDRS